MKKLGMYIATLALGAVLLPHPAPAEEVEISVLSWTSVIDYRKEGWAKMIAAFEAANPDIKVRDIGVPDSEALKQLTTMILGNNAPDVSHVFGGWIPQLVAMGALAPINEYVSVEELAKYPKISMDAVTFDGEVTGLPFYPGPIMMFYNRNLMEQAGLNPDQPPKTWPELTDAIEKICALKGPDGQNIYGAGLRTIKTANTGHWAIPVIWGHGGSLVDQDGKITLTDPGTKAAMEWYRDLTKKGCVPEVASHSDTRNLFAQGQAGFIFEGPWGKGIATNLSGGKLKVAADGDVWASPMPAGPDGQVRMMANDNSFVVLKQSKHPEAAVKFMNFVLGDIPTVEGFYQATNEIATGRLDVLEDSKVISSDPFTGVVIEAMKSANPMPINDPKWNSITDVLSVALQRVITGEDSETVLENAQAEVERKLR